MMRPYGVSYGGAGDRPDLAPDGQTVALNVFPSGPADTYTSLIYQGPFVASIVNRRLNEILEQQGLKLNEVRGVKIKVAD